MRQLATALLTVLVLVGAVTGPAMASVPTSGQSQSAQTNDHLEPNDDIDNATRLRGGPYSTLQIVSGESDFFKIHLQEGERLETSISFSHSSGDLDLYLYNASQQIQLSSASITDGERIAFTASQTGWYYVEVQGYRGASAPYSLSMNVPNNDRFESNDNRSEAAAITPGSYSDPVIVGGESDYFAVDLEAGDRLEATSRFVHASGDLDMTLYAPNGSVMDMSASWTDNETVAHNATQNGTYYVEVYGFQTATAAYDLELTVASQPDDVLEENDVFATAQPVAPTLYSDLQLVGGDRDYYAIPLDEGESVSLSMDHDHSEGDLDLAVYDPDQHWVTNSYSATDDESVTFNATQSGDYYVMVYGYNGASAAYDLSYATTNDRFELNDNRGDAHALLFGDYDNLRIQNGEDDYFAVQLDRGQTLNATTVFDDSTGDLDLWVEDPSGNTMTSSRSVSDDETVLATAQQSGTHYVRVEGYRGATAPYDLSLALENDRFEDNDVRSNATGVSDGRYADLHVVNGENDYYAVQLQQGERLNATTVFDHSMGDIDLWIRDPGGSVVRARTSTTDNEVGVITAQQSGTYYVQVEGFDGASAPYELELRTRP